MGIGIDESILTMERRWDRRKTGKPSNDKYHRDLLMYSICIGSKA